MTEPPDRLFGIPVIQSSFLDAGTAYLIDLEAMRKSIMDSMFASMEMVTQPSNLSYASSFSAREMFRRYEPPLSLDPRWMTRLIDLNWPAPAKPYRRHSQPPKNRHPRNRKWRRAIIRAALAYTRNR